MIANSVLFRQGGTAYTVVAIGRLAGGLEAKDMRRASEFVYIYATVGFGWTLKTQYLSFHDEFRILRGNYVLFMTQRSKRAMI